MPAIVVSGEAVAAAAVVFVEVVGILPVAPADRVGPVRSLRYGQALPAAAQTDVGLGAVVGIGAEVQVFLLPVHHRVDVVHALGAGGLKGPLRGVCRAALCDPGGRHVVHLRREQIAAPAADLHRAAGQIVCRGRPRAGDDAVGGEAVCGEAQLRALLPLRLLRRDESGSRIREVDDLQVFLRGVGQGDAHRDLRGGLHGLAAGDNVNVEESGEGDVLRLDLEPPGRLRQILLVMGRALQHLADPELRAVGNLRVASVGHRDVVGAAVGGQNLLGNLRVADGDLVFLAALGGEGQRLLVFKGLLADQGPVSRLRSGGVDPVDLGVGELGAVLRLQVVLPLEPRDGGVALDFSDPDQVRAAELHRLHILDEFLRLLADFDAVQCQCVLFQGLALCIFISDAQNLNDGLQIDISALGQAEIICFVILRLCRLILCDRGLRRGSLGVVLLRRPGILRLLCALQGPEQVLAQDLLGRLGILRQQAVAQQLLVVPVVVAAGHLVLGVALDGVEALGLVCGGHNADMVGRAVPIEVEEDQIAGIGQLPAHRPVHLPLRQLVHPCGAGGELGHGLLRDAGIVQAEGDEHAAPILIGEAVPGAVAGIAVGAVAADLIVLLALGIAQLALCHGQQVVRPDAGQLLGQGLLPVVLGLQVGARVGVAGQTVGVLLQGAGQHPLVAFLRVPVAFALLQGADQRPDRLVAFLRVGVIRPLLQGADQLPHRLIAFVRVDMALALLQGADQIDGVAAVGVGVLNLAAVGRLLQRDGRQDQSVGRTEYNQARQKPNEPSAPSIRFFPFQPMVSLACRLLHSVPSPDCFLLIGSARTPPEARRGRSASRRSAPLRRSRSRRCGNPQRWLCDPP